MRMLLRLFLMPTAALLLGTACAPAGPRAEPGGLQPAGAAPGDWDVETMLSELDQARRDPAAYAGRVRAFRALFRGDVFQRPGQVAVATTEGTAAVDDAIRFLERASPLPPLTRSAALDRAATDHVRDQGRTGRTGHVGADGSEPQGRMARHGRWRATAEAIAYGPTPEEAVMQLIVDDGVPDRGHRRILFSPTYEAVGAACGPHPTWRTVCVLTFATPSAP